MDLPLEIGSRIFVARGRRVLLDSDLALLYGVLPKRLREQVRRNLSRFPPDFGFRLTVKELRILRPKHGTSSGDGCWVFTQHGAVMLAGVLNSDAAIDTSVDVVRAFVRRSEGAEAPVEGVFEVIRRLRDDPSG